MDGRRRSLARHVDDVFVAHVKVRGEVVWIDALAVEEKSAGAFGDVHLLAVGIYQLFKGVDDFILKNTSRPFCPTTFKRNLAAFIATSTRKSNLPVHNSRRG